MEQLERPTSTGELVNAWNKKVAISDLPSNAKIS